MSTFSTTVTKAQRNAVDYDSRGRAISICSRQHTKRPGYNPSPYEPKVAPKTQAPWSLGKAVREKALAHQERTRNTIQTTPAIVIKADMRKDRPTTVQVRPSTKRGSRSIKQTPHRPIDATLPQFYKAGCEFLHSGDLVTTSAQFMGIKLSAGDVCTSGCAWFKNGACPAYKLLLERERGLIK